MNFDWPIAHPCSGRSVVTTPSNQEVEVQVCSLPPMFNADCAMFHTMLSNTMLSNTMLSNPTFKHHAKHLFNTGRWVRIVQVPDEIGPGDSFLIEVNVDEAELEAEEQEEVRRGAQLSRLCVRSASQRPPEHRH